MRSRWWYVVALVFVSMSSFVGCLSPTPVPVPVYWTPTPLPTATATPLVTPTPTPPPALLDPIRLAWFYKPPPKDDWLRLTEGFSVFILTRRDEELVTWLKDRGLPAPILQYVRFDAIHDPGDCDSQPRSNQVAYRPGDFCAIDAEHPEWFLLDQAGQRIVDDDGDVYMDPGQAGWRAFWLERIQQMQAESAWDGLFLDNVEASLTKHADQGRQLAAYTQDEDYEQAVLGFLQTIARSRWHTDGHWLYANIIAVTDEAVWFKYLEKLDGVMVENFGVDWEVYYRPAVWETQQQWVAQAQMLGKQVILVAQGRQADTKRQTFTLASYLLIDAGTATFRYTHQDAYDELWRYSNYTLALGYPLGPRYRQGDLWLRDFSNGQISLNPVVFTATITTR